MTNNHDGFRSQETKDKALEALRSKLTDAELARIQEQRKLDSIEQGTKTYDLALYLDTLKRDLRQKKLDIYKRMWNVENISNSIASCKAQIESGNITEKMPESDIVMTEIELKTYIKHQEWLKKGEVLAIPKELSGVRALVGHKDLVGNVIMTEEEFNGYYDKLDSELKRLGHKLLEE